MSDITVLPPVSDPHWRDLVMGNISKAWELLALKIMMTRIVAACKADPSAATVEKYTKEVHDFFEKNMKLAQNDLHAIFG